MHKTPLTIPSDLREIDESMYHYGQWARRRMIINVCGSMERRYRAPEWEGESPAPALMPTYAALDIQRIVQRLPLLERMCLWAQYNADDHGFAQRHCHRHGVRRRDQWIDLQIRGLRMLKNRLHPSPNM